MKKIFFLSLLALTLACKNETKEKKKQEPFEQKNKEEINILKTVILPNYPLWTLNRLKLKEENGKYDDKPVFKIERTSTTETAYASVNNISVLYGQYYRVSILVKQATVGNLFSLRIIGEYPNRVDAVFDVENGVKKGVTDVGDFIDGTASIEAVGDGWYRCSVIAEVNADIIKIILGPTFGLNKITTWEAPTNEKCNNYILPSSLKLEELSN